MPSRGGSEEGGMLGCGLRPKAKQEQHHDSNASGCTSSALQSHVVLMGVVCLFLRSWHRAWPLQHPSSPKSSACLCFPSHLPKFPSHLLLPASPHLAPAVGNPGFSPQPVALSVHRLHVCDSSSQSQSLNPPLHSPGPPLELRFVCPNTFRMLGCSMCPNGEFHPHLYLDPFSSWFHWGHMTSQPGAHAREVSLLPGLELCYHHYHHHLWSSFHFCALGLIGSISWIGPDSPLLVPTAIESANLLHSNYWVCALRCLLAPIHTLLLFKCSVVLPHLSPQWLPWEEPQTSVQTTRLATVFPTFIFQVSAYTALSFHSAQGTDRILASSS